MTLVFVALVTQVVAIAPRLSGCANADACVVVNAENVRVLNRAFKETELTRMLRSCLGDAAARPDSLTVDVLVGDRGVVVSAESTQCVVRAHDVVPVSALKLSAPVTDYRFHPFNAVEQRIVEHETPTPAREPGFLVDSRPIPGSGALEVQLFTRGVVKIVRDGGVDPKLTKSLINQLAMRGPEPVLAFDTQDDGGLVLTRDTLSVGGACPVGHGYDESRIEWTEQGLKAGRLGPNPSPPRPGPSSRQRANVAVEGFTIPEDRSEMIAIPGSGLTLFQWPAAVILRDGHVDVDETNRLRAFVKEACIDTPFFDTYGWLLQSSEEELGGRCSSASRIGGCSLVLEYDTEHSKLIFRGTDYAVFACLMEADASECVNRQPDSGEAELAWALSLGAAGETDRMKAHLEVAIAKGLPVKQLAEARRRLAQ